MDNITQFDFYAANAPEAPKWFEPVMEPKPKIPLRYSDMYPTRWDNIKKHYDYEINEWAIDAEKHLTPEQINHFVQYRLKQDEAFKQKDYWEKAYVFEKFFQWRIYYAKEMVERVANKQF